MKKDFAKPRQRKDGNSRLAHAQLLEKKGKGTIRAYFLGDSITRRWGATDYPDFLEHWKKSFHGWDAANFGWGGDTIENMVWRVRNGELDGVNPKLVVLLAGTNNIGKEPPKEGVGKRAEAIVEGLALLRQEIRSRAPGAQLLVMGIFPRNDNAAAPGIIGVVNQGLAQAAAAEGFRFLDLGGALGDGAGGLRKEFTVDGLHLSKGGYEAWANALRPHFRDILGEPAATDSAPPPTGDPSAKKPLP